MTLPRCTARRTVRPLSRLLGVQIDAPRALHRWDPVDVSGQEIVRRCRHCGMLSFEGRGRPRRVRYEPVEPPLP